MKVRTLTLLFVAVTLFAGLSTGEKATAQDIISENLFNNPGWEAGYYNQDQIAQIAVPNGWRMHWLDGQAFEGTNGLPAYRPETVVWNIQDAPENERSLFFRDGIYTFKIFKSWAPLYAALSQDVTGLEVGRKYRISAPIFIDIIEDYQGGKKVPPADPRQGFVRFGAGPTGSAWLNASQISYSPYWTAENVNPFYQTMPIFIWDFVATQPDMTLFIEMGSKYPYRNNGFFMDGVGLYALNETTGVANPSPGAGTGGGSGSAPVVAPTLAPVEITPREDGSIVHLVGANDSFWTIAIRYASVLEMTAEQALPYIQEINGNPAFVIAGQELLIREPGNYVDAASGGEETAASETPAAEEATVEEEAGATEEEGRGETGGDVIVVEGVDATATPEAAAEAPPPQTPAGVCVSAFDDANGNGQFDSGVETLKSDAAITLFKDGQTISTYITDGVSDSHCFQDLASGTYQVQLYPPANYVPTTADAWAISVSEGVLIPLQFGIQFQEAEITQVAAVNTGEEATEASMDTAVVADSPENAASEATLNAVEENGLLSNIGVIVIIVAIVLILLAGAGVVMLRRG